MIKSWNTYIKCAIKTNSYHLHFQRHRWSEIEGFEFLLGLEDVLRPSCNRGWHALTIKGRGQILICESKIASYCCFLSPSKVMFKRLITKPSNLRLKDDPTARLTSTFFNISLLFWLKLILYCFYYTFSFLLRLKDFEQLVRHLNVRLHFEVIQLVVI